MLWLYILLGIVSFFAIILAIPIKVCVQYKKQFFCRLRIGFVKIILYPPVPKKKKPKKKKKTEQPQKPAPKKEGKPNDKFLKELGLSGIVNLFTRITELAAGVLKDFFAHIIIKSCRYGYKLRQGLLGCLSADKCGYKFNEIYALRCGYSSRLYGGCGNQD